MNVKYNLCKYKETEHDIWYKIPKIRNGFAIRIEEGPEKVSTVKGSGLGALAETVASLGWKIDEKILTTIEDNITIKKGYKNPRNLRERPPIGAMDLDLFPVTKEDLNSFYETYSNKKRKHNLFVTLAPESSEGK